MSTNDRAREIWGYPGTPLMTDGVGSAITLLRSDGERLEPDEWPIARLVQTGRLAYNEEIRVEFADRRRLVLLVNAAPIYIKDGTRGRNPAGGVVTFVDITARKQSEEDLRAARDAAEASSRAKELFMATLSHEFRTPLNGILGYTDLLVDDTNLDAEQRSKLRRIEAAVQHLNRMIEEILALSDLDLDAEVLVPTSEDARKTARAAVDLCGPVASEAGLALRTELPSGPVELLTDHHRLRMILVNLVGNALKFTRAGEIRLRLRVEEERVLFSVHDTGIGIDPENHELIFERFWQVNKGLTRRVEGVGIGLSAAREFARMLGGDLTVESHLQGGSVFTLWLPVDGPPAPGR